MYCLRLKSKILSYELRKLLVSSLIIPYFDYCCLVYDALDVTLTEKVKRILNLVIRFIFRVGRYERVSISPLRNEVNMLTAKSRRKYLKLVLVHSMISIDRPPNFSSQFKIPDETIRRLQRNLVDTSLSQFPSLTFTFPIEQNSLKFTLQSGTICSIH